MIWWLFSLHLCKILHVWGIIGHQLSLIFLWNTSNLGFGSISCQILIWSRKIFVIKVTQADNCCFLCFTDMLLLTADTTCTNFAACSSFLLSLSFAGGSISSATCSCLLLPPNGNQQVIINGVDVLDVLIHKKNWTSLWFIGRDNTLLQRLVLTFSSTPRIYYLSLWWWKYIYATPFFDNMDFC